MNTIGADRAAALLRGAENILVVTHIRPDGDTAGSAAALCLALRALGKQAYTIPNPPSMERYNPYMLPYFAPEGFKPDFVVAVDTPGERQFPVGYELLAKQTNLAIDHHDTNSGYAEFSWIDRAAAACGEMIYELLGLFGIKPTLEMAEALYVSLSTDSGCFRTSAVTPRTLRIAADLLELGVPAADINHRLFEVRSAARVRLESIMFATMSIRDGICTIILPLETIRSTGVTENDMDKLSLLTLVPEEVTDGILLRQMPDRTWKISVRTDGTVDAGKITALVGGGGHAESGGAVTAGNPDELAERLQNAICQMRANRV